MNYQSLNWTIWTFRLDLTVEVFLSPLPLQKSSPLRLPLLEALAIGSPVE